MPIGDSGGFVSSSQTPDYKPDQNFNAGYLEKILRAIEAGTPRRGVGYEIHNTNRGWTIGLQRPALGRKLRFFVVTVYEDNGTVFANVSVGMVNRTIPKLESKFLDQTLGEGRPPRVAITADLGYVGIKVTYQSGKVFPNESEIEYRTELQTNDTSDTSFYPLAVIALIKDNEGQRRAQVTQLSDVNLVVNRMKVGTDVYSWSWSN
jgi:hypothetical protein